LKSIENTEFYKFYKFDIEELLKVKVDLTFIDLNSNYSTKDILDWAKTTIDSYPEIKPIIQVLKRYLQIKKLNSSFNGGLSSFSLLLLIVAYLKYPKVKGKTNLGRILIEFLELYGKFYNYSQSIIDVNMLK
jgi:non-canonical poly(A) RNA polymerase PAPD5/7